MPLPKYHDEDFERAFNKANDAFWEAVAKEFPDIKTGDFPPFAEHTWQMSAMKAITTWVRINEDLPERHCVFVENRRVLTVTPDKADSMTAQKKWHRCFHDHTMDIEDGVEIYHTQ